jgi:mannitol-1-phosphate 5-dehydrogenase
MSTRATSPKQALIIGAGAIGRGFLAPRLVENGIAVSFADVDPDLIQMLDTRAVRTFQSAIALEDGYEMLEVPYSKCTHVNAVDFDQVAPDYLFFCVGVKELRGAAQSILKQLPTGANLTAIYSLENEPATVDELKEIFGSIAPCYFCVPDVITSSRAPTELLQIDPACVASEVGEIYLEGPELSLSQKPYTDAYVAQHWLAKKYLHNTPHAALAYLGAEKGFEYIHQAALDEEINRIILSLVRRIRTVLQAEFEMPEVFLNRYVQKELKRFRNKNLYDPIARVARNPDVKLLRQERILFIRSLFEKYHQPCVEIDAVIRAALAYQGSASFNAARTRLGLAGLLSSVTGISPDSNAGQEILSTLMARDR